MPRPVGMLRSVADTTPAVRLCVRPSGLPTAYTASPTGGGPAITAGTTRSGSWSGASTAMSLSGLVTSTVAPAVVPSANASWMRVAPSTTCSAVSTAPAALMTTPLPSRVSMLPGSVAAGR